MNKILLIFAILLVGILIWVSRGQKETPNLPREEITTTTTTTLLAAPKDELEKKSEAPDPEVHFQPEKGAMDLRQLCGKTIEEASQLIREKKAAEEDVEVMNYHADFPNYGKIRIQLVPQPGRPFDEAEVRFFAEDAEGIPTTAETPPNIEGRSASEVVDWLTQNTLITFSQERRHMNWEDGSSASVTSENEVIVEIEGTAGEQSVRCDLDGCSCL